MNAGNTTETKNVRLSTSKKTDPAGIGGWLRVLIVLLVLVWPLVGATFQSAFFNHELLVDPALANDPAWNRSWRFIWLLFAVQTALSISAGLALLKCLRPIAVRYAKAVIWINGPGFWWVGILITLWNQGLLDALSAALLGIPYLLGSLVFPLIWTTYLRYSKRVKNTYRYDEF